MLNGIRRAVAKELLPAEHTFRQAFDFRYQQIVAEQQMQAQALQAAGQGQRQLRLGPERDRFRRMLSRLTEAPFVKQVFGDPTFECERDGVNVTYRALGYAAHFTRAIFEGAGSTAALVSLDECKAYGEVRITVTYMDAETKIFEDRPVWNVHTAAHGPLSERAGSNHWRYPPSG